MFKEMRQPRNPPRKQRKTALGSNPAFALGLVLLDAY